MRAVAYVFVIAACGGGSNHHLPDAPAAADTLTVTPADLTVTVVNGVAVTQGYTATLTDPEGNATDVTATAVFSLADASYGNWAGPTLSVTGQGAGPTRVQASAQGASGDTGLTVLVNSTVIDPSAPPNAGDIFGNATEDPALAPTIVYPNDKILVPPNLGQFDVHWSNNTANTDNLFEVEMTNQYVDVKLYTTGLDPTNPRPFWTLFSPEVWYPIASSKLQLTLSVVGLDAANPVTKGTAVQQTVDVTNENAQGGIYYWSTSSPQGIYRYDVSTPDVPPAPFFPSGMEPGGAGNCMGCHSLSRDGSKIALTIDSAGGRGTVLDVATQALDIPYDGSTQPSISWNFATFTPDATKLVTVENGVMTLRTEQLGTSLVTIDNSPSTTATISATHPEISPDGTHLVNVESTNSAYDIYTYYGSIVTRTFDNASNTFGAITPLVTSDGSTNGNYYPSYSPDGQWIVFTRTSAYAYNDASAEIFVVKADGSMPPIQLAISDTATPNLTNSWARWVPFAQSFGPSNESLFYLTFSSQRPFGVRIPNGGQPQIWMTPFFPDRAIAGMDPSGPAFRVPFQDVTTNNHIAQWTAAVIAIQ